MKVPARAISTWEEAGDLATAARQHHRTVVFTTGAFDLLHPGHLRFLEQARGLGDMLIVGLSPDRLVRATGGPDHPINPEHERAEVLLALSSVDAVVLFDPAAPDGPLTRIQPDLVVPGEDAGYEAIERMIGGGKVVRLEPESHWSTAELIRRIRQP